MPALAPALLLVAAAAAGPPTKLIIDTDIGGGGCKDVDDVGAVCLAHAAADAGLVELLAIVVNTAPPLCPAVVSVLNHYYGRDDVPIGSYKGSDLAPTLPDGRPDTHPYVPYIVENFPSPIRNASQVPSSVDVYRSVLAAQPQRSVTISSIGLMTNLRALLVSPPDRHSPLRGYELVAQKVRLLAVMGGTLPSSYEPNPFTSPGPECNFDGGRTDHDTGVAAAAFVYSHMPPEVQIIFAGGEVGHRCFSGGAMSDCQPVDNPCRAAYIKYEGGTHKNRHDADPVTTLMAIAGPGAVSCSECTGCDGVIEVSNATGGNRWIAGAPSNQSYLVLDGNKTKSAIDAGAAIDALLCKPRKVKTDDGANRRSALLFFDDSALQEHNLTRVLGKPTLLSSMLDPSCYVGWGYASVFPVDPGSAQGITHRMIYSGNVSDPSRVPSRVSSLT